MFMCVPVISFWFLFLVFRALPGERSWRDALLSAALVWGVLCVVITELLSAATLFSFRGVLLSWIAVAFCALAFMRRIGPGGNEKAPLRIFPFSLFAAFSVCTLAAAVGLVALVAPTNNADSLVYHLPRIAHWIQNRTVAHYPTHELKQLLYTPGAEFIMAHFMILTGSDRSANVVQWLSMVGCVIGVSLIAQALGADSRGQVFSALICATIPMGILQGSSARNDYVTGFWLVCCVYYLALLAKDGITPALLCKAGAGLGLAVLTKGTAYLFAVPFLVWLLVAQGRRSARLLFTMLVILFVLVITINIGYFCRAFDMRDGLLLKMPHLARGVTAPLFLSNVIRNIAVQLGTPFHRLTSILTGAVESMHAVLGIDAADPRISTTGSFSIPFSLNENSAGNALHTLLLFVSAVVFLARRRIVSGKRSVLGMYLASLLLGFLIFSYCMKWDHYNNRYLLPLFVLAAPFIAVVLSGPFGYRVLAPLLILASLPFAFCNTPRPLIGKENVFAVPGAHRYFAERPYLADPYRGAVDFIASKECTDIGIILGNGGWWEYPFFPLLRESGIGEFRLEHVGVSNISSEARERDSSGDSGFAPCAIISFKNAGEDSIMIGKKKYVKGWSSPTVREWHRKPITISVFVKP